MYVHGHVYAFMAGGTERNKIKYFVMPPINAKDLFTPRFNENLIQFHFFNFLFTHS